MMHQFKQLIYDLVTNALFKVRIIPVLIVSSVLLMGVKFTHVFEKVSNMEFVSSAMAVSAPKPNPAPKTAQNTNPNATNESKDSKFDVLDMDSEKVKSLMSLSKKRDSLNDRENNVKEKEAILLAVEKKIDEKTANLEKMQKHLNEIMNVKDSTEKKSTERLVQMYEKMKPADAAAILEGLDLATNIELMENFKETKASAILAVMDRTKARYLTMQLAQRRKSDKDQEPPSTQPN